LSYLELEGDPMPFVHIRLASPTKIAPERIRHLQIQMTRLMSTALRKKTELTSVLVEEASLHRWAIGGEPAPVAAHLDVKVTQGTNTSQEKEHFIASAAMLLREVMGDALPVATYVVVDEIAADAWGYDGLSQEERRRAALSARAA
jgi:4-oxalocrotonate tautomerase